ncbi:hypothetical protein ACWPKS_03205 [Coraliomargarita sp. W4R72]
MSELYIQRKAVWTEPHINDAEALANLKAEFPGRSARRMTRLGMQLSHVLRQLEICTDYSLVYATTYSETCTIEKFLDSFPFPSPQAFQTSIHPGGVEQFLIQNKQSITEFFPLAGMDDLLLRALDTVLLCSGQKIILCGGEERGTWLADDGVSSETNYAWGLELQRSPSPESIGRISWQGLAAALGDPSLLADFIAALESQATYFFHAPEGGQLELSWSV